MATKKTKRVETPIDQRETFVSIKKNFAEGEVSVEEKLEVLYALQKADSAIDKILQLRGELPAEVQALEEEIATLNDKAARMEDTIAGLDKSISMNKQEMADCEAQIEAYRAQLNNIANSREYDSLNKEIENQELLVQIAGKNIREAKELIESQKAALSNLRDRITIRDEDLKAAQTELEEIVKSTAAKEKKLLAEREVCAAKIDERTMSAYERIRSSVRNHLAIVELYNGNACGGCFNTIIPQRVLDIQSRKKLVICEHCGRIIVAGTPEAE